jgi:hypothetical protein
MPITMRSPAGGFDAGGLMVVPGVLLPGAAEGDVPGEVVGEGDGVAAHAARNKASGSAMPGRRRDGCPTPRILRELNAFGCPKFL